MVAAAFPLAKLGVLVIKQVSKPIAKSIADRARSSQFFRSRVCIPTANLFHWYDVKVRMKSLNLGDVKNVPKLNEKNAIDTGAQILSEMIIFGIAAGILLLEMIRQSEKEEAKQEQILEEKDALRRTITNLEFRVEKQSVQIRELTRLSHGIQDQIHKKSLKSLFNEAPQLPPELEEVEKEAEEVKKDSSVPSSLPLTVNAESPPTHRIVLTPDGDEVRSRGVMGSLVDLILWRSPSK
uniref:OPA3-like protein CG13603 n=1 Tax=Caligus rogercresseyi TaxID=217165 RepID=C1BMQ2_CALRO|nr:OPA3-like protein CG13603 [Caligus rogercresseyi]